MRRSIRERQTLYGLFWGAAAFIAGWVISFLILPQDPLGLGVPDWKQTAWVFINLNGIPISGSAFDPSFLAAFRLYDTIQTRPELAPLRILPILLTVPAAVLANEGIGYTRRSWYLIQNSAFVVLGYVAAGLATIVITDARPGLSVFLGLFVLVGLGIVVGSMIVRMINKAVPVLALTTLGGILLIGIAVISGIALILQTILPLIILSLVGSEIGGGLLYVTRNLPW